MYIFYLYFNNHSGIFYICIYTIFGRSFGRSKTEILSSYGLRVILNLILTAINTVFLSSDYCSSLAFKSSEHRSHISSRREKRDRILSPCALYFFASVAFIPSYSTNERFSFGKVCSTYDDPSIAESRCDRRCRASSNNRLFLWQ